MMTGNNSNPGQTVLVFDFDGVIVDSLDVFYASLLDVCREHGLAQPSTREQFLRLFNTNLYDGLRACGLPAAAQASLLAGLGARLTRDLQRCQPFPGIPEAFARLARQSPLVVVTSSLSDVVRAWLGGHGIAGIEDVLGADCGTGKVAKIQSILQRYPGATGYYVGDTRGDMIEGRAAGARTVAVTWGWHEVAALAAARPDLIVHTPAELAVALGTRELP